MFYGLERLWGNAERAWHARTLRARSLTRSFCASSLAPRLRRLRRAPRPSDARSGVPSLLGFDSSAYAAALRRLRRSVAVLATVSAPAACPRCRRAGRIDRARAIGAVRRRAARHRARAEVRRPPIAGAAARRDDARTGGRARRRRRRRAGPAAPVPPAGARVQPGDWIWRKRWGCRLCVALGASGATARRRACRPPSATATSAARSQRHDARAGTAWRRLSCWWTM